MVSAQGSSHDGETPENAYMDLHYEWDFGDTEGVEEFVDRYNGKTVNANNEQQGQEAAYLYRSAGTYTITLTAKGKDESGNLVTASTTTLLTIGQHYLHLGGATGGTYTLTFEGQTTSAIPFNAAAIQIVASLRALPNLDATNVRTGLLGLIEFEGNWLGQSYSFTGDFAGLTGTVSTPSIRTESTSGSAASVSVSDLSGLTAQYFDSNYDGSNGAPDGTEDRPYTAFASLESFLEAGGSRVAWLKRGSSWAMDSRIKWDAAGHTTIRVLAYGTGDAPVLTQTTTSANFYWELAYGTVSAPNKTIGDFVFSGLSIVTSAAVKSFYIIAGANGTKGYPYARLHSLIVDSCTWTTSYDGETGLWQASKYNLPTYGTCQGGTTGSVTLASGASSTTNAYVNRLIAVVIDGSVEYSTVTAYDGTTKVATVSPLFSGTPDSDDSYIIYLEMSGSQTKGVHIWNCDMDAGTSDQVAIIQSNMGEWHSIVGSTFVGGTGSLTYDHHVYMYTTGHALVKYVQFGAATKNLCINGNCNVFGGPLRHFCVDGSEFTGTQNGIDMSNTDNIWVGSEEDGYFDQPVLQFSKIHSGEITTQQIGVLSYNLKEATVRFCDFWDNGQAHISISNTANYPWQPKMWIYDCRFYGGRIEVRGSQAWYFHDNTVHAATGSVVQPPYCLRFYDTSASVISSWDADGNIWFNSNTTNPFYDADGGSGEITFATWQAAGNDAAGSLTDPLWNDPGSGVFIDAPTVAVEWPAGFSSLEVSSDGVSWSAYTNNAAQSIGAALSTAMVYYFRAVTDSSESDQDVVASYESDSLDSGGEAGAAVLAFRSASEYLALAAGGLIYFIRV